MKVLFIGDNPINNFVGGNAENRKYYDALKEYCRKNEYTFRVITRDTNIKESLGIPVKKSKKIDILVRLQGHSSFLYKAWKDNLEEIKNYMPDLLVLGRSRFGFIAKSIKSFAPNCKVLTNVDNVELDFVNGVFANAGCIKALLLMIIEKLVVYRDEMDAIRYSDKLIFLTKRNIERYAEIYDYREENPAIVPICLENELYLHQEDTSKTVIFIGSLDYDSNILAIKRLLHIWNKYYKKNCCIQLLIAGRNPTKEVTAIVSGFQNVQLISNFTNITDIVPNHSLMLAPIDKGAGMKTKVAESLSMGLMIAASDEALIGYEAALARDSVNGIVRANMDEEYKAAIDQFLSKSDHELVEIENQNRTIFKQLYSYDVSRKLIETICVETLGDLEEHS